MKELKVSIVHLQMVKDAEVVYGEKSMAGPREAAILFKGFLGDIDRECLVVCATDTKMKPTYIQIVGMGAVNYCTVSIPEIYKAALLSNSANIVLAHNHPSGDCTPSSEDISFTGRVLEAGRLFGIRLMDHIILGESDSFCSLRENHSSLGWEDTEWKRR